MINLEHSEDRLTALYEELNLWAINDIVDRIMKNEVITETAKYRIYRLQEAGIHLKELKKIIKKLSGKSKREINLIFKKAAIEDIRFTNKIFIGNEIKYVSDDMKYLLNYYADATNNDLLNLNTRIENTSYNTLLQNMDKIHYSVVSGLKSQSQAISEAIDNLGNKGLELKNLNGRNESIESIVRRYVHTGVNKCVGDINLTKTKDMGLNHVLVSSHLGARHIDNPNPKYLSHDIWQGKVYKVDKVL